MISVALNNSINNILCCPACKGKLEANQGWAEIRCIVCSSTFPVIKGIPNFLVNTSIGQEGEKRLRDEKALEYEKFNLIELINILRRHHSIEIMKERTQQFEARFGSDQWVADLGVGWGWHWTVEGKGPNVVGIDISMNNLLVAKRILEGQNRNIALICADASNLPIRDSVLSGSWSVQVFQHMPENIFQMAKKELCRVMMDRFHMEIYNLNPAWLLKMIYRFAGKTLHLSGEYGGMEFNRFTPREWGKKWEDFKKGSSSFSYGYSELFFHPDLRICPGAYPVRIERFLAGRVGRAASLFARQGQVIISGKGIA